MSGDRRRTKYDIYADILEVIAKKGGCSLTRISYGANMQDIYGKKIVLRNGACAENICGESITIEAYCKVLGQIRYTKELKIEGNVSLHAPPQKVGTISI